MPVRLRIPLLALLAICLNCTPRMSTADDDIAVDHQVDVKLDADAIVVDDSILHDDSWIVGGPPSTAYCDDCPYFATAASCASGCRNGYWANAEYLYWHERGMEIPALVTASTPGTAQDDAGVLGQPTTAVLLGNDRFVDDGQSGGRFSFGFWIDDCRDFGLDVIYTTLFEQSDSFAASSDENAILGRPFFNVDSRGEDARILAFPGELSGGIRVDGSTEYDVVEVLIRRPVSHEVAPTYIVYGYRYAELDDSLRINDTSLSLAGASSGTLLTSVDSFRSRNTFHGFEAGILTDFLLSKCWQLNLAGKVAFGETEHVTTINGQTISTNAQGSATSSGGLLTQQSNIGSFETNSHGVLQDFTIRLRRTMQCGISANLGYAVHRWTEVARAGEQIDRFINPTQIPPGTLVGEARPAPPNATSGFVAQGITFGLEFAW